MSGEEIIERLNKVKKLIDNNKLFELARKITTIIREELIVV